MDNRHLRNITKIGIKNIEKMPQKLAKITQGSIKIYKIKV